MSIDDVKRILMAEEASMGTGLRIPPHDDASERGVLGSVLLDPDCMDNVQLDYSEFYDRRHQTLWEQLCEMRLSNYGMDAITVAAWLKDKGALDKCGGYDYLSTLQESAGVSSHSQHYAGIVREKAKLRAGITTLSEGIDSFYRNEDSADTIRCDVMSMLASGEVEEDEEMHVLGEKFLEDCKNGNVGHYSWWCNEWTYKLGKMSSDLVILHAPRSTGKTAMMLQWVTESHRIEQCTPLASIEMLKKELAPRFISNIGQVSTFTMRVRGSVTLDEERKTAEALSEIRSLNLCIRDKAMTIDDIRAWAIKMKNKCESDGVQLGAIYVDNLLSISDGGKNYQSKTIMYDDFIRKFRDLRDILQVPIIVLAHPNQEGGIAWSKDVENFADIILYLYQVPDEGVKIGGKHIEKRHDVDGVHVVGKFQKNRNGIQPVAHLDFVGSTQTFSHLGWEE